MDTEKNWLIYYKEAANFYKENNHLNIPCTYVPKNTNIRLGTWIGRMRTLGKNGKLSKEKMSLLNEISMIWDIKEVHNIEYFNTWMIYYNELVKYYKEHNDIKVPSNYSVTTENGYMVNLHPWLNAQKSKLKSNKLGYNSEVKTKLLEELGIFKDDLTTRKNIKENNENVWLRNYEAVKEYYKKHENLDIPYTYTHIFSDGTSINLGVWFKKQICSYFGKAMKELTNEQYELLTLLGVDKLENTIEKRKIAWEEKYILLEKYYNKYATLEMPPNYLMTYNNKTINIGSWFRNQCERYRCDRLNFREMKMLRKLGIDSYLNKGNKVSWLTYYRAALNYYNTFHNLLVPTNYVVMLDNRPIKLGEYLSNIRSGKIVISDVQKELLNRMNMIWDVIEFNKKIYYVTWLTTYNAVKEYTNIYGNHIIPENYIVTINGTKVKLSDWINLQFKLLEKNMLNSEQISKLSELGISKKMIRL